MGWRAIQNVATMASSVLNAKIGSSRTSTLLALDEKIPVM